MDVKSKFGVSSLCEEVKEGGGAITIDSLELVLHVSDFSTIAL